MAQVGGLKAVVDTTNVLENQPASKEKSVKHTNVTGWMALFMWKGAYFGKQVSWKNRILIPMYWFKSFVFGRDVSRF